MQRSGTWRLGMGIAVAIGLGLWVVRSAGSRSPVSERTDTDNPAAASPGPDDQRASAQRVAHAPSTEPALRIAGRIQCGVSGIALRARIRVGSREIWSDSQTGRFSMRAAGDRIEVSAMGFETQSVDAIPPADELTIELMPIGRAVVRVVDGSGLPLGGSAIRLEFDGLGAASPGPGEPVLATADSHGLAGFPCGVGLWVHAEHGDVSSETVRVSPGDDVTLTCAESNCARLGVRNSSGVGQRIGLMLRPLDSPAWGPPRRVVTEEDGLCRIAVPSGRYVVKAVGSGVRFDGLAPSVRFEGQLLRLTPGQTAWLETPESTHRRIRCVGMRAGEPVRLVSATLEVRTSEGWLPRSRSVPGDAAGWVTLDGVVVEHQGGEEFATGSSRLRIEAPGFEPAWLPDPHATLANDSALVVTMVQRPRTRIRVTEAGREFTAAIRIVTRSGPDNASAVLDEFAGIIPSIGVDLALLVDGSVVAYPWPGNGGDPILDCRTAALDVTGGSPTLDLPERAVLTVDFGAASEPIELGLRSADGSVIPGVHEDGRASFEGLWPGDFVIAPFAEVLAGREPCPSAVELTLTAGEHRVISSSADWATFAAHRGVLRMADGSAVPSGLRVVPLLRGRTHILPRDLVSFGTIVRAGGEFVLPSISGAVESLLAISRLPDGSVVEVGRFEPRVQLAMLDARRVTLELTDAGGGRAAQLLITLPFGRHAERAQNVLLPCSTAETLDLGVLPSGVEQVVLIVDGSANTIHLPAVSGVASFAIR